MKILTISDEGWLDGHGARWARYARGSNPDSELVLLYAGDEGCGNSEVLGMFDRVHYFGKGVADRDWYNIIRLAMVDQEGEYLYCDLDADILQDMSHVKEQSGDVMWVRSPAVSEEWKEVCKKKGWRDWGANNGLLYVRKDYSARYKEILEGLKGEGCSPRLVGTYAFNQMVRESGDKFSELPYYNSVIWWDYGNLVNAKVVQWCNSEGQSKRLELERVWRDAL